MLTLVAAVVIFCLIIFIHEFGHFASAKLFGVTVHEFSIGMGKKLFSFNKKGTQYSVRILPIGGYVKLEGEDEHSDDINAFSNKNVFVRFVVLFSGAFMNFVLGFLLYVIIMSSASGFASNVVGDVLPNSAFFDAGIVSGDVIVKLEGESYCTNVNNFNDINFFNYRNGNSPATITYKRDGIERAIVGVAPKYSHENGRYLFGFTTQLEQKSIGTVIKNAYYQCTFVIKVVLYSFVDIIRGSLGAGDISGPVGIVNEIGNAARAGFITLVNLAAMLSINLGVINLLPLPALDGGRIFFLIIELLRRKPIPPEKEGIVHAIGFVILLIFMLTITFFDISKLLT